MTATEQRNQFKIAGMLAAIAFITCSMNVNTANAHQLSGRWTNTASGPTGTFGSPVHLTWGFVPDGTASAASGSSNFIGFLDNTFGAGPGGSDLTQRPWFGFFEDTFDRFSQLSGLSYSYEPNDDGATHSQAIGRLGIRADVRLAGSFIDGPGGTLAFNFFPNNGDATFDTADGNFYGNPFDDFVNIRNTIAHEHGHGIGLAHVESGNGRFLLEPFIQNTFDGPQLDDILGIQRGYGDFYEKSNNGLGNDVVSRSTPLGAIGDGESAGVGFSVQLGTVPGQVIEVQPNDVDFVSIDDNSDTDFYSFTIDSAAEVDVLLTPAGYTYREGAQNGTQSTYPTSTFSNLNLTVFDSNGTTVLASDNSGGLGEADSISALALSDPGEYFVRVRGAADEVQLYQLEVSVTETVTALDGDFNDDGVYDCADINALTTDVAGSGTPASFDLDGDGWFSEAEMTPAAEEAMQEFTSDTGRTFAPAFGIPFTAIWVGVCFAILYSAEWIARLINRKPKKGVPEADLEFNTNVRTVKNENPFHPPSG